MTLDQPSQRRERDAAPAGPPADPGPAAPELDPLEGVGRHGVMQMAALLVPGLYGVLLVSYLLRTLGPDGYAPWVAAAAIVGWLALLDAGLSSTTTREAARAIAGDPAAIARVGAANAAYALLGVAAVALGSIGAALVPVLLRLADRDALDAWLVGALLALDLGIVVGTAGWVGIVRGSRRFDLLLLVNVAQVAVAAGLLIVLVPPLGLVGAALAQPVGRLVGRALLGVFLARRVSWHRPVPSWPGWAGLRPVLAFSVPILAIQAAAQIGMGSDVIIVGAAAGATAVGLYAAGSQLVRYVGLLLFPALGVLLPAFSAIAYQRPDAIPDALRRAVFVAGLIGASIFGGMVLQAPVVVELWSGQSSALSVGVLTLYALAWALVTPVQILVLMLVARGRHAVIGAIIFAEALANLALSIVLVLSIGPIGAAVATIVAVAVDDILVIPVVAARLLEIALAPIVFAGAAGLAAGALLIGLVNLVPVQGVAGLVLRVVIGGLALATALWFVLPQHRLGVTGRATP